MSYERFKSNDPNYGEKNIFLTDMRQSEHPFFSYIVQSGIQKAIDKNQKVVLIVNKKGFASGHICTACGHIPKCQNCDVSISYHKSENMGDFGLCHVCKKQYSITEICPNCFKPKLKEYGIGTQKAFEIIYKMFGVSPIIIESETVNSINKIKNLKQKIADGNDNVFVGTSLLTTPILGIGIDLVIYLNADIGLSLPDFGANERNFLFLYEGILKYQTKNFIVQTFNPDQHSIRFACKLDKKGFYEEENKFRKKNGYPPFGEIAIILYKHEIEESLHTKVSNLYKEILYLIEKYKIEDLKVFITPPLIYKMFGKYRYNLIIKGPSVRDFMDIIYTKLEIGKKGFKIDWQPDGILN